MTTTKDQLSGDRPLNSLQVFEPHNHAVQTHVSAQDIINRDKGLCHISCLAILPVIILLAPKSVV